MLRLSCILSILLSLIPPVACFAQAEPGEIILTGANRENVKLIGAAKFTPPIGKPEDTADQLKNFGQEVSEIVRVGTWGKQNLDDARVEFSPDLPKAGYYDVYIYTMYIPWPGQVMTPMEVHYENGKVSMALQRHLGGAWAFLGTYSFAAGTSGKVAVDLKGTEQSSDIVGVKFVPVADPKKALATRPKVMPVTAGAQDEFDKLRLRYADLATYAWDANVNDPKIASLTAQEGAQAYFYWKTMGKKEGQTDLWQDIRVGKPIEKNEGGGWPLMYMMDRLRMMAAAYVGSNAALGFADKMQGNPELLQDILYGLNWHYQNRFNERSTNKLGADWMAMEVFAPLRIAQTVCLIFPHVSKEFIEKQKLTADQFAEDPAKMYGKNGPTTGFNRLVSTYKHVMRGIMEKDPTKLASVPALIADELRVNRRSDPFIRTSGNGAGKPNYDGYYADGSFIQHVAFPYIGIYGRDMIDYFSKTKTQLDGSKWAINDSNVGILTDWVTKAFAPVFFNGDIMYGSLGRSTGQSWAQNGHVSAWCMDAVLSLIPSASPEDKAKISSIVKTWVVEKEKCAYPEFNDFALGWKLNLENFLLAQQIKNDPAIPLTHPPEGTHVYYNTDYVVHQQPDFAMQLRMFSTRIKNFENIDGGQNMLGRYQGEGALFLYNRDNSRYNDNFWATVNPHRLPGSTVDGRPTEQSDKDGEFSPSPWAGGVELDGFGLASMGLAEPGASLTAQKAWFFFKDQIVCLGNEIKSTDNGPIETIVENVKLYPKPDNAFFVNGTAQPTDLGWQADLTDVKWAHLSGTIPGTDVGWVFPGGASLKAVREARTGNWTKSFRRDASKLDITRNYLTLWYDHGTNPTGATYSYIVLPGRNAAAVKAYEEKPEVEILANTPEVQAAMCKTLNITGANFWSAGKAGGITSSGKVAVLVHEQNDRLSIGVADPTQLETSVEIALDAKVSKGIRADDAVKVVSLSPLKLSINFEKSDGKTLMAEFQK